MPTKLQAFDSFYLKREDENPSGSAKDRAVSLQVDHLLQNHYTSAVISSTGNAAISAAFYCLPRQLSLTVFLSPKVDKQKLSIIFDHAAKSNLLQIVFSNQPISEAIKFSKSNHAYLLRQSTDPVALSGYQKIGEEILDQLPQISSLFLPVGSGATLIGISQKLPKNVKIFACQSAANCQICSVFSPNFTPEPVTLTDALTAKFSPLKSKVIATIRLSGGTGFVIQNREIAANHQYLHQRGLSLSPESALCLAALRQAQKKSIDIGNYPVIVATGVQR